MKGNLDPQEPSGEFGCLYRLTSPSGKSYIGITKKKSAHDRWFMHIKRASYEPLLQSCLSSAIRKYGADAFVVETLVVGQWHYLLDLEPKAIRTFGTRQPDGYNMTDGGEGVRNPRMTAAKRQRASEAQLRRFAHPKAAYFNGVKAMQKALQNPLVEAARRRKISATMRSRGIGVGTRNAMSKLRSVEVRKIKRLLAKGEKICDIMEMFGVSRKLVYFIKVGKRWAHVR